MMKMRGTIAGRVNGTLRLKSEDENVGTVVFRVPTRGAFASMLDGVSEGDEVEVDHFGDVVTRLAIVRRSKPSAELTENVVSFMRDGATASESGHGQAVSMAVASDPTLDRMQEMASAAKDFEQRGLEKELQREKDDRWGTLEPAILDIAKALLAFRYHENRRLAVKQAFALAEKLDPSTKVPGLQS